MCDPASSWQLACCRVQHKQQDTPKTPAVLASALDADCVLAYVLMYFGGCEKKDRLREHLAEGRSLFSLSLPPCRTLKLALGGNYGLNIRILCQEYPE